MKNYLSFGGGVNSVALYLYLLEHGVVFEAVFVDHGTDWPETYEYVEIFKEKYPLTILKPEQKAKTAEYDNLYDYCFHYAVIPSMRYRWCTVKFKIEPIYRYCKPPAFMMLGIDFGEKRRQATIRTEGGFENRYPLIEAGIDREGCKSIISSHNLPIPMKSGCYICPYQRVKGWKELRRKHPGLFCKAVELEKRSISVRKKKGKNAFFLNPSSKASLENVVNEKQGQLFKGDEYPPCECGL